MAKVNAFDVLGFLSTAGLGALGSRRRRRDDAGKEEERRSLMRQRVGSEILRRAAMLGGPGAARDIIAQRPDLFPEMEGVELGPSPQEKQAAQSESRRGALFAALNGGEFNDPEAMPYFDAARTAAGMPGGRAALLEEILGIQLPQPRVGRGGGGGGGGGPVRGLEAEAIAAMRREGVPPLEILKRLNGARSTAQPKVDPFAELFGGGEAGALPTDESAATPAPPDMPDPADYSEDDFNADLEALQNLDLAATDPDEALALADKVKAGLALYVAPEEAQAISDEIDAALEGLLAGGGAPTGGE